ncbi:MAG: hypothetical protein HYT22_03040 [Candidatus Niyogibacteria bacterium]|nr:hypothetical protein [Candidatus Niyogibacteria bacterium]
MKKFVWITIILVLAGLGVGIFLQLNLLSSMERGRVTIIVKERAAMNDSADQSVIPDKKPYKLVNNQMILIHPHSFLAVGIPKDGDSSYAHMQLVYFGITSWNGFEPAGESTIEGMPYGRYKIVFVRHRADPHKKEVYAYCPRFQDFKLDQETLTLVLFRDDFCFDAEELDTE